jgi:hypothetical protein
MDLPKISRRCMHRGCRGCGWRKPAEGGEVSGRLPCFSFTLAFTLLTSFVIIRDGRIQRFREQTTATADKQLQERRRLATIPVIARVRQIVN